MLSHLQLLLAVVSVFSVVFSSSVRLIRLLTRPVEDMAPLLLESCFPSFGDPHPAAWWNAASWVLMHLAEAELLHSSWFLLSAVRSVCHFHFTCPSCNRTSPVFDRWGGGFGPRGLLALFFTFLFPSFRQGWISVSSVPYRPLFRESTCLFPYVFVNCSLASLCCSCLPGVCVLCWILWSKGQQVSDCWRGNMAVRQRQPQEHV